MDMTIIEGGGPEGVAAYSRLETVLNEVLKRLHLPEDFQYTDVDMLYAKSIAYESPFTMQFAAKDGPIDLIVARGYPARFYQDHRCRLSLTHDQLTTLAQQWLTHCAETHAA